MHMYFKYKITYAIQQKTTLSMTALPTTAIPLLFIYSHSSFVMSELCITALVFDLLIIIYAIYLSPLKYKSQTG